jgi:hypothetical protein
MTCHSAKLLGFGVFFYEIWQVRCVALRRGIETEFRYRHQLELKNYRNKSTNKGERLKLKNKTKRLRAAGETDR